MNIYIVKDNKTYDITSYVGNVSWSDSVDTLGSQLDFSTGYSSERYFPNFDINCGDIVVMVEEYEIFRGIIVTKDFSSYSEKSYTAVDFLWYFNKSKVIKQFNGINAGAAIGQLCSEFSIPVGSIAPMRSLINHIYYENTVSEIIDDILEQEFNETGKNYIKEIDKGQFYVFEKYSKTVQGFFRPAINIAPFDVTLAPAMPSRSFSIEEMKNSIVIVSGSENAVYTLATAEDTGSLSKYGLLQEVESVDDEEKNKAQNIAENRLKEYNKVTETVSIQLLGDFNVRSGRVIAIKEDYTGLNGNYFIKSCSHSVSSAVHTMDLELEAVN